MDICSKTYQNCSGLNVNQWILSTFDLLTKLIFRTSLFFLKKIMHVIKAGILSTESFNTYFTNFPHCITIP